MENCEAMTSSTHSFAYYYSYRLVKNCFLKICETSKCHNFLIFQPILIRFSLFCWILFTLSSEIKLNLFWISSLMKLYTKCTSTSPGGLCNTNPGQQNPRCAQLWSLQTPCLMMLWSFLAPWWRVHPKIFHPKFGFQGILAILILGLLSLLKDDSRIQLEHCSCLSL